MSNPYAGPRPFERADRHNFYGREREVEELLDLLTAERVVLLYSPSGAGKSSLLAAGLIPRLEEEHFRPLPIMRVSRRPPGMGSLSSALAQWLSSGGASRAAPPSPPIQYGPEVAGANRYVLSLLLYLEEGLPEKIERLSPEQLAGLKLAEYLKQRYDFADAAESQVLIVDQFEEVLTLRPADQLGARESTTLSQREHLFHTDFKAKQEFFAQVGAVLRNRRRWAVFALREDYVAGLDPYLAAIPTRLANTYRLNMLDCAEALEAVCRPAAGQGVEFTAAAAEKLVDDLRQMRVSRPDGLVKVPGPHVEPVQLQVVCLSLWEQLRPEPGRKIAVPDLDVLGDVDNALMGFYDNKIKEIATARGVREREIREWFDRHLITVQGRRGQVLQGDPTQTVPDEVAADLVNAHLIREDKRAGSTWFELAHDRLIDPIRKSNDAWNKQNLSPLQRMASIWDTKGRPPDKFLLRHQELQEGEAWAETHAGEINDVDRAFLQACRDHQARGEAERSRKKAAFYRWVSIGTLGLGLVLIGLSALAITATMREKEIKEQEAKKEKARADRGNKLIRSEQLAKFARDNIVVNPEFGVFLALKGLETLDDVQGDPQEDVTEHKDFERAQMALRSALNECAQKSCVKRTLLGHKDEINAVTYSSDGALLATASSDGTARLWDADSGELLRTLDCHPDTSVNAVAFSPDCTILATASENAAKESENGIVKLWQLGNSKNETRPVVLAHKSAVNAVAFSSDGKLLAAGTQDGSVVIWEVSSGQKRREDFRHAKKVNAVAFNPKFQNRLVTASDDGTVMVWEPDTRDKREPRRTLPHGAAVTAVAFKPDGMVLATACEDSVVRLWYAKAGQLQPPVLWQSESATATVRALAFHPDNKLNWLAIGSRDSQVQVWETTSGRSVYRLYGHQKMVTGVAFRPGSERDPLRRELATSSDDSTVKVWNLSSRQQPRFEASPMGFPTHISFSAGGKFVAAGSWDGWAKVWDTGTGTEAMILPTGHRAPVRALALSSDGKRLLSGSDDATAKTWETASGRELTMLSGHDRPILGVAFSPDGQHVATASQDGTARVWDWESRTTLLTLEHPFRQWPLAVAYSTEGMHLATAGSDGIVRVWDSATGEELYSWPAHTQAVTSLAFSPSDRRLLTGSHDGTARIWDLNDVSHGPVHTLEVARPGQPGVANPPRRYNTRVYGVAYSPDGKRVATCGEDMIVHVWDAITGAELATFSGHKSAVWGIAFSPNGKHLASASSDRTARVWDLDGGKEPLVVAAHNDAVFSVAFQGEDGRLLWTASSDRAIRLWDATQRTVVRTLGGQATGVSALSVSPDGNSVAVARNNMTTFVHAGTRAYEPRELADSWLDFWLPAQHYLGALGTLCPKRGHTKVVVSIAFSPDGTRVATGSWDRTTKIWEVETGRLLGTCVGDSGHKGAVTAVAFSFDGEYLATGSQDKAVKLWNGKTGDHRFDLLEGREGKEKAPHTNTVNALAFSPDGMHLATGSQDQTIKIWDMFSPKATRSPPRTLTENDVPIGGIYTLAFSPNSKQLAAVFQNGTVKVWDVKTGDEILYLDRAAGVYSIGNLIAFEGDERLLAVDANRALRDYWLDLVKLREVANKRISPPDQRAKMEADLAKLR
jgi:WD40 repeat protein